MTGNQLFGPHKDSNTKLCVCVRALVHHYSSSKQIKQQPEFVRESMKKRISELRSSLNKLGEREVTCTVGSERIKLMSVQTLYGFSISCF